MSMEEKERVAMQQQSLGEEGLKEKGQQLQEAIAQNEVILGNHRSTINSNDTVISAQLFPFQWHRKCIHF